MPSFGTLSMNAGSRPQNPGDTMPVKVRKKPATSFRFISAAKKRHAEGNYKNLLFQLLIHRAILPSLRLSPGGGTPFPAPFSLHFIKNYIRLPPDPFQKLNHQHRAKRQPHNGTDHTSRQRSNCEQRLQRGNQQHQPQQQAACGKGP